MREALLAVSAAAIIASASLASAEMASEHTVYLPQHIELRPGPPSLPAGAESAILAGDPAKDGMFALRIKAPKGYSIPPHTHAKPEIVTIISGKIKLGMGAKADPAKAQQLPAGSISSMPAGVAHYVFVDEESVVQINAMGPWGIDYVDPRDDPRLNIAPAK